MKHLTLIGAIVGAIAWVHVHAQSSWTQKGSDIDGEAAYDEAGTSVSMPDANTVAIGARHNDGNGTDAGHVRVYTWSGTAWIQKGGDIDGEHPGDRSGWRVSMPNANTVAIASRNNSDNGTWAGHVRIYTWNGTAWVQKGSDIDGEAAYDESGSSISMPDANTIAIGAFTNDGNGSKSGHVRVYTWNGTAWVQKGSDLDGEAANDRSGRAVSMPDSNTVAIGAMWNDGNGPDAGHVRVYTWNGTAWVQKGGDIDGEAAGDWSGHSVSMPDANTVAIGAPRNDGNGPDAGHVRVYTWNGTAWVQKGGDIDGEAAGDWFGIELSMPDPNTVAIGAQYNNGNGTNSGHVRVYEWSGTAWVQVGGDIDGEAAGDESGVSVSMVNTSSSLVVAIGAIKNDGNGTNSGHVRVYELTVLPVELISFAAEPENGKVRCRWATASETNNHYFTVLRSKDGKNFEPIGTVKGAGNSTTIHKYSFVDEHPYRGTSYYQLRQTDFDGTSELSEIVAVHMDERNSLDVVPTFTDGKLLIQMNAPEAMMVTIRLYNSAGQLMHEKVSREVAKGNSTIEIDAGNYPEGIYVLKVVTPIGEQVARVPMKR